ncbi:AraC family ligand binding domain-containing protein [Streptomyces sp. ISL-100]|uniref:AraC family ligand binding domain-containing protein n=1 Tax=Streptomyces sp. ISL-100 TaxID=2819173 RepID=UPI00203565C2|nr:AraC family ligand binding domain-containing protein [Streptomyces sp. ISL-100]
MRDVREVTGGKDEWARHWQYPGVPGLDLLRARYVRHSFSRHSHEGFVLGAVFRGIEDVVMPQGTIQARPGTVVMINPEVPHAAHAGVPEGWSYATLYPSAQVVAGIAEETTSLRGTAGFAETIVEDADTARLIRGVHRAAEEGNALAADSLLRIAVARLLRRHGQSLPARAPTVALLAELTAQQTFSTGQHLVLDARGAGLVAAALALVLRAPFLVVVGAAVVVTAGVRAISG